MAKSIPIVMQHLLTDEKPQEMFGQAEHNC
jgi:hypothetical protein